MKNIQIEKARQDTPGCNNVLHFNNAGAALIPSPVLHAVKEYIELESQIGAYETAIKEEDKIRNFYPTVAEFIHAKPSEISFIENATRAWDMAFYSLSFKPGDKIITTVSEYASNYIAFLQVAKRHGAVIDVIPNDSTGQVSVEALKKSLDSKTKLISLTHIPTQGGLVNPAEEVGKIANDAGVFYLLDATQSIGQMPIDVNKIGCDALCATGRKYLRGPRGTGFLYVKESRLIQMDPPFLDMHAANWSSDNAYTIMNDGRRFETWEMSYANLVGLSTAIQYAKSWGIDNIWNRIQELSSKLRQELANIPGITLEDLGAQKCGIVTFIYDKIDPKALCLKLRERKINVSVSYEDHARLDLGSRHLPAVVRSSVHYYNTEEEIHRFIAELKKLA